MSIIAPNLSEFHHSRIIIGGAVVVFVVSMLYLGLELQREEIAGR